MVEYLPQSFLRVIVPGKLLCLDGDPITILTPAGTRTDVDHDRIVPRATTRF